MGITVLSLFDGMSCGQIALERAGIEVDNYYASEIDKYAIKIGLNNFPNTLHLGDVKYVKNMQNIDLLIGGSPCQGFSFAGKQLNFDDPRSKLFFEYVRLLDEASPTYFLLENVNMKKESLDIISEALGVEPIRINSSLVSAQRRDRWYWTNIPDITIPEDRNIKLEDIIEEGFTDKVKSYCIDANYFKGGNPKAYFEKSRRQLVFNYSSSGRSNGKVEGRFTYSDKALTLCAGGYSSRSTTGVMLDDMRWRKLTPLECERLQTVPEGYTEGVSNTQRYKMLGNGWTVDVIAHIFKGLKNGLA